ncbi:DUF6314 family protein [Streptomyces brasiliscabiei]|uniref:DUF6314 family protein n=1 Tax=Streptomyces brasiliscabiei TaxID=2736302 RepID=UPI001C0F88A4|nr:DUF6314 family protein [Streptomyces brasiliscabiei]
MGDFLPVPDVLAHLAGRWRVLRSVRDLAGGAEGEFSGTTVFGPPDDDGDVRDLDGVRDLGDLGDLGGGLLHREAGTFVWQGVPRPAERTLRFLPGPAPGTADVRFADGRPFHDLDLTTGHWRTDHPCVADLYRGEFEVYDEDRWRTTWRVGGPAKDLLLVTDYTREPPGRGRGPTARRPA